MKASTGVAAVAILALLCINCGFVAGAYTPAARRRELSDTEHAAVRDLDAAIAGLDTDIEMHSSAVLIEARRKLMAARQQKVSGTTLEAAEAVRRAPPPPRLSAHARLAAHAANPNNAAATTTTTTTTTIDTRSGGAAPAAAPAPGDASFVETFAWSEVDAAVLASGFHGIRTEKTRLATDEKGSPATGPTVVVVSSYLLVLLVLGTFVLGSALGWMSCKCVDTCCRSPTYV